MNGVQSTRALTPLDRKLETVNTMLSEVISAIATKFVTIQAENPFLAIEALFRFQSAGMIQLAMNNYDKSNTNFQEREFQNISQFNFDQPANAVDEDAAAD